MTENPRNLGAYYIIEVSLVLHSAQVVPKNQIKMIFYVNNTLMGTSSTNYMTLIGSTKIYGMQMQ